MDIPANPAHPSAHPPRVTRVGVGVIVVRAGRVLLGERRGSHGAGTWALPGGNLDFGESVEECARRELLEETGITLHSVHQAPYTVDHFPDDDKHYVTLFVEALDATGDPALLEPEKCCGWSWFDWHDFPERVFGPLETLRASGFVPQGVLSRVG